MLIEKNHHEDLDSLTDLQEKLVIRDSALSRHLLKSSALTSIKGLGSAFSDQVYTQDEITKLFAITDRTVLKLMASGHVRTRHLYLPSIDPKSAILRAETPSDLHTKFKQGILDIGVKAGQRALDNANLNANDIDVLIAVTSTGFLVPGVSSLVSRALGMKQNLHRMDLVGMGCNAGMSALYSGTQMSRSNPEQNIMILCCEINSASYVRDNTVRTGIVNSLFGDGATAVILNECRDTVRSTKSYTARAESCPQLSLYDFESFTIPEQHGAMTFTWDESQYKWSFYLSKDIPFVIGKHVHIPVEHLLNRHGIVKENIKHWVLHTGGGAVIDGAKKSLSLNEYDVRHTRSVLRDYGNISSGSFLVSLERLQDEGKIEPGDLGVLIAMGPGATIEAALVQWN